MAIHPCHYDKQQTPSIMKWPFWILLIFNTNGFAQSILEHTEFYDGTRYVSSQSYRYSWTYKFELTEPVTCPMK